MILLNTVRQREKWSAVGHGFSIVISMVSSALRSHRVQTFACTWFDRLEDWCALSTMVSFYTFDKLRILCTCFEAFRLDVFLSFIKKFIYTQTNLLNHVHGLINYMIGVLRRPCRRLCI